MSFWSKLQCLCQGHSWRSIEPRVYHNQGPSLETVYVPQRQCSCCGKIEEIGDGGFAKMFNLP